MKMDFNTIRSVRVAVFYTFFIGLALVGVSAMVLKAESPAQQIVGEWEEVAWEYEMVDAPSDSSPARVHGAVTGIFLREAPVVHKFESWEFCSDGTLCLIASGHSSVAKWRLKGRGHILELDNGTRKEYYRIMGLSDNSLVINYDTDLEVRGIAKLTFVRKGKNNDL